MLKVDGKADAAIVLAGAGAHLGATLKDLRARAIPTAVLAVREDASSFARLIGHPTSDVLVGEVPAELLKGPLADWVMERLPKQHAALAHNFEFVRRAVAKEAVKRCAWQNAAIGVVIFVPGADMPLMTLNQGRMLLQIAAAYGEPLDKARIKELAAVVAGGLLFRTFAREAIGLLPGLGWAIKGGIAYSGTVAMGMAAIGYFEKGIDLSGVVHALAERAGEVATRVGHALPHGGAAHAGASHAGAGVEPVATVPALPKPAPAVSVTGPGAQMETPAPGAQPTLIDVPPVEPTFVVLDDADGRGGKTGPAL
jgi:uncharacterized protein (DUF697 family)